MELLLITHLYFVYAILYDLNMNENNSKVKLFFKHLLLVVEYLATIAYAILGSILVLFMILWNLDDISCNIMSKFCSPITKGEFIIESSLWISLFLAILAILIEIIWLTNKFIAKQKLNFKILFITIGILFLIFVLFSLYIIIINRT